ncbi:MAG TPA: TetR/AcrR family transcriptional regulator [Euzebya sp.]|nr:TetR/AcrR family transcriptional regulator [Euzebya sp.]
MVSVFAQPGAPSPTAHEVILAAERLLASEGVEALTMRRLAAELGTSYQVVYSRIGSKPDVVRALHAEGMRRLTEAAKGIVIPRDQDEHLIALAQGYLAAAVAHPALFDVMFGTPVREFTRDAAARHVEWRGFEATWVDACRTWLDARHDPRPRGASVRLAWRLWTAVHGITVLHLAGHDSPSGDVDAEIATIVKLVLRNPLR